MGRRRAPEVSPAQAPRRVTRPAVPTQRRRAANNGGLQNEVHTLERAIFEVKRIIVGQDQLVERMLVGLLAKGHVLLEGVPGVAKTLAVETFAKVVGGTFARIQFTPDLVPTDIVGTRIYRQGKEEFDIELGPVMVNFLLADEINRAPPRCSRRCSRSWPSARSPSAARPSRCPARSSSWPRRTRSSRKASTPLPEAQRDRFLFKLNVDYPTPEEEREIIYRMGVTPPKPKQILNTGDLLRLQDVAANIFVHHALVDYVVRIVTATREPEKFGMPDAKAWIAYGASPRASLGIIAASRALALVRGRDYVIPQDVVEVIPDVLRHRLVLDLRRARRRDLRRDGDQPDHADRRAAAGECHSAARSFGAARHARRGGRGQRSVTQPSGRDVDLPSLQRGRDPRPRALGRAAQARADRPPQARRRAARRPSRAASRPRLRAGGVAASTSPVTTCAGWTGR